jgi:hypothetical protein
MTQTAALTSPYGLGTAKKAGLFVAVDVKFVAKPRVGLSDGNDD